MKKFKITIEDKTFEVSVSEQDRNVAEVIVDGQPYTVGFERENTVASKPLSHKKEQNHNTPSPQRVAAPTVKKAGGSSKSINSPLPGNIFKVLVSEGGVVKRGETLIVIESMKMENNILADRDGIVKAIYVQSGQSVLQGDALVDLE